MGASEASGSSCEGVESDRSQAVGDDPAHWGQFLTAHRDRLRRMVALRLDHRLRGRIDPSDVIQEAFLEATERRSEYDCQSDPMPPFLWLRFLTLQRLQLVHRRQLGTRSRDAARDISIDARGGPGATSAALAAQLLGAIRAPAKSPCGPNESGDCSRRLTGWTRSTARCWFCGTSSSSPMANARGCWA